MGKSNDEFDALFSSESYQNLSKFASEINETFRQALGKLAESISETINVNITCNMTEKFKTLSKQIEDSFVPLLNKANMQGLQNCEIKIEVEPLLKIQESILSAFKGLSDNISTNTTEVVPHATIEISDRELQMAEEIDFNISEYCLEEPIKKNKRKLDTSVIIAIISLLFEMLFGMVSTINSCQSNPQIDEVVEHLDELGKKEEKANQLLAAIIDKLPTESQGSEISDENE